MVWATREEEPPLATGKPRGMWGKLRGAVRDHHPTLSKPPTPYRPTFSPSEPGFYRPPVRAEFACVADYQEAREDYRKRMRHNRGKGVLEEEESQWQGRAAAQGADTTGADTAGADTSGAGTAGADTSGAGLAGADTAGSEPGRFEARGARVESREPEAEPGMEDPLIVIHLEGEDLDMSEVLVVDQVCSSGAASEEDGQGEDDLPPLQPPPTPVYSHGAASEEDGQGEDDLPPPILQREAAMGSQGGDMDGPLPLFSSSEASIALDSEVIIEILANPHFMEDEDVPLGTTEPGVTGGEGSPPLPVVASGDVGPCYETISDDEYVYDPLDVESDEHTA